MFEDVPLAFSLASGSKLSSGDVDDGDDTSIGNETVQVTLTATSGTLT